MDSEQGIPGFTIEDEDGKVLAANPGQVGAGRRVYNDKDVQTDRTAPEGHRGATYSRCLRKFGSLRF